MTLTCILFLVMPFLSTIAEMGGRPKRLLCGCRTPGFRDRHIRRPLMLVHAGCDFAVAGLALVGLALIGGPRWADPVVAAAYAWLGWCLVQRWRKHPKDPRGSVLGRVLARVRVTAAGLRVVPLPVTR